MVVYVEDFEVGFLGMVGNFIKYLLYNDGIMCLLVFDLDVDC